MIGELNPPAACAAISAAMDHIKICYPADYQERVQVQIVPGMVLAALNAYLAFGK